MKNTEIMEIINAEVNAHKALNAAQYKIVKCTRHGNGYTVSASTGELSPLSNRVEYYPIGVNCNVYGIMGDTAIRKTLREYFDRICGC